MKNELELKAITKYYYNILLPNLVVYGNYEDVKNILIEFLCSNETKESFNSYQISLDLTDKANELYKKYMETLKESEKYRKMSGDIGVIGDD